MSTSQGDHALEAFKQKQRRKNIKRFGMIGVLVVIVGVAAWYFFFNKADAAPQTVIRFAVAEHGDIIKAITATGTIQATKTVQVGTQVSGVVRELHADFNSTVKKGDLIAVIDPTFYEAAIQQSEANYEKAIADQNKAKLDAGRAEKLFQQNLLAKSDYDAALATSQDADATVKQSAASLQQAKVNLGYTQIHAPISGTIVSRNVDVGQTVAASLNAPVIFIIAEDLEKMQVWASVDEADIGSVHPGQQVTFTVDAYGDEKFQGVVNSVRLNATITQNVVNYTVIIDADNPDLKLLPSMTATVTIINSSKQNVLRVPVSALRFTPPDVQAPVANGGHKGNGQHQGSGQSKKQSDSTMASADSAAAASGIIYIKAQSKGTSKMPSFEAVSVSTGISDGLFMEINPIGRELKSTDSIAIGMYSVGGAAGSSSSTMPGTNPFGGAAARGGRR
ncbi:MAG TPA: efflux RND transporter periplasmic adaptor subunit [Candidatus Kapabacteria bacterium]|nr:efflux RND transporter periplasmic adaptor subunit [Candidatus Kapabacteria bacterium]